MSLFWFQEGVSLQSPPPGQRPHIWNMGPWTETPKKEHGTKQPDRKWHHTETPLPVDKQTPVKTLLSRTLWRVSKGLVGLFQLQRLNREARRNLMSRRVITEAYEPEDLPRGVWREGPRRDVSTYPGECGGKGRGETWVPTRGSVEGGPGERREYLPGECGGRDRGETWVPTRGSVCVCVCVCLGGGREYLQNFGTKS